MEMPDIVNVIGDVADEISLHNLHVVDVVKQLRTRRTDTLAHLNAPLRLITLVIGVVDFAVEQLDAEVDALLFGSFGDARQPFYRVIASLLLRFPLAVAGEAYQAGDVVRRGDVDILEDFVLDSIVVLALV